jgi:hypothetical protein
VIAGGAVRAVVEAAGIHDVLSKSLGSANKVNVVRATEKALKALTTNDAVARRRGLARPAPEAAEAEAAGEAQPAEPPVATLGSGVEPAPVAPAAGHDVPAPQGGAHAAAAPAEPPQIPTSPDQPNLPAQTPANAPDQAGGGGQ